MSAFVSNLGSKVARVSLSRIVPLVNCLTDLLLRYAVRSGDLHVLSAFCIYYSRARENFHVNRLKRFYKSRNLNFVDDLINIGLYNKLRGMRRTLLRITLLIDRFRR